MSNIDAHLGETAVSEAIMTLMRGPAGDGLVDAPFARTLAIAIRPNLAQAYRGQPPSDLSADTTFKTLVANHLTQPASAEDEQARQALLRTLQTANVSGAEYTAALAAVARAPQAGDFGLRIAALIASAEGRGGGSTIERTLGLSTGYYTAHNLPPSLRGYIDGPRASPAQVALAANFATSLGMDASRYAGHFVGTSDAVRTALREHVRSGAAITDRHVTSNNDARAVIAAIQAGKLKPEEAPPSVQKMMEDMRAKGLDPATADAKAIEGYFQQNPKALEVAKAQNAADDRTVAPLTQQQAAQSVQDAAPSTAKPLQGPQQQQPPKPAAIATL